MALQFQGYGDPFARQKMEQQQKQQQYDNLINGFQMAGRGIDAYQQSKRRDELTEIEKAQNARQQFLFDRQYKPNPMEAYFNQTQGPAMQQGYGMIPGTSENPMYGAPTETQESPIVAMDKRTFSNGVPPGMSRADYAESLGYQKTQADIARDNAIANQQYVVPQYDANGNMTGATPLPAGMKPTSIVRPQQQESPYQQSRINNQNRNSENQLRSQFLSQSKDYSDTATSYQRIIDSTRNPTPAGDLSLLYNYMKMLDPGSTVREGEFASAAASGSYGERFKAAANQIINGQRLSDEIRNDFINRANELYGGQKKRHEMRVSEFKRLASDSNLNPSNVIIDLNTPEGGFTPQQKPMTATNPKTGQKIKSIDGGKTWQPM